MSRRATICLVGVVAVIVLWLFVRDNTTPPLGYFYLLSMEFAWVSGLVWGYFTDVKEKQEQENNGHPRPDQ